MKMKFFNTRRLRILADYIVGWTIAFLFLVIIRGIGTEETGPVDFELSRGFVISLLFGPVFGLLSGLLQILIEERIYRKASILRLLAARFTATMLFLALMVAVFYTLVTQAFGIQVTLFDFIFEASSAPIYFYIFTIDFLLAVLRQVNLMLGPGNLLKLLMGHFYTPREVDRIFLFVDLQSSTTLAEELGHIHYSELLQDCFNELGVTFDYGAEIYQYVGDEAILTWPLQKGIHQQHCLKAFFAFRKKLEEKRAYYEKTYGTFPRFKAGLHAGRVTVTEVGKFKKELAYHGDPINTTARIQAQCNALDQMLLVSESLYNQLDHNGFDFEEMGQIKLRGKAKSVAILAVKPAS